jgi:hypothetical protein
MCHQHTVEHVEEINGEKVTFAPVQCIMCGGATCEACTAAGVGIGPALVLCVHDECFNHFQDSSNQPATYTSRGRVLLDAWQRAQASQIGVGGGSAGGGGGSARAGAGCGAGAGAGAGDTDSENMNLSDSDDSGSGSGSGSDSGSDSDSDSDSGSGSGSGSDSDSDSDGSHCVGGKGECVSSSLRFIIIACHDISCWRSCLCA